MIRKPMENETQDCIKLLYMSGPDMFSYFLIEREPEVYKYISFFYSKPDVLFSKENILVKIEDSMVCGLLLSVPVKTMKQKERNMMKYGWELFKITGIAKAINMGFRAGMQKHLSDVFEDDEYYISNLAVFQEYRGKGFGIELLEKAEELAVKQGLRKLSLAVEFYNHHAKQIYEKFGFVEKSRIELPGKYHKYSIDGFYKMVKVLDAE